ncbi:response regulator [Halarcobacter anaerophilus]|uniref:response regulator n=1 Tax=Halarcobacter anaerophilus TaxID=877500 RepID=UPI000A9E29F0|nr:response regulator [Halarcobacter anaerophilus]
MNNNKILENTTVLYAEDEDAIQNGITETLNLFGINVICAKNGEEGVSFFKSSKKKLI